MALHVVILAAGKGTRMKSSRPKVLHALAGRPVIEHVLRAVDALRADSTVVVIGHGADDVRTALGPRTSLQFAVQSPQLGTGHALLQAESALAGKTGTVLLVYADVPLLQVSTLSRLIEHHRATKAAATVLTTELAEPYGYGRIVRDEAGRIARIVEERDASGAERDIKEINSGIYCFDAAPLFGALKQLAADNAQGEYYLTDLVAAYRQDRRVVETLQIDSPAELRGVNSRVDLSELGAVLRARKNQDVMIGGVTLEDAASTYIDADVTIGPDTVIGPGVILQGSTSIGERCEIQAGSRISNSTVGDGVIILDHSIVVESRVDAGARIGPFSHLRPGSVVSTDAHVGNFVELKKTTLGPKSKANHLAYLGDATIGERVNIGAGTITCNYDGVSKHPTVIEDGVFIGSDSQLIAPVRIGANAYVAAGSSITKDVPADALGVARAHQENKPGWAARRRARHPKGSS
ncbi:MAG TPA: bifunctional UDP-N-acetylglucosamine diphosphorylase/glucosamine-1-phosphate N-acetyltransferase GlmU [Vicinamibacterales bacterium]|nr:bifunctional UDP-N-acetylglucosamine diphosphorylase/glucosamine-1-phosphate N-acetyltransferase GlmU [Vicinamibacterales bacterium]